MPGAALETPARQAPGDRTLDRRVSVSDQRYLLGETLQAEPVQRQFPCRLAAVLAQHGAQVIALAILGRASGSEIPSGLAMDADVHFVHTHGVELGCWRRCMSAFSDPLDGTPGSHQADLSCDLAGHGAVAMPAKVGLDQLMLDIAPQPSEAW